FLTRVVVSAGARVVVRTGRGRPALTVGGRGPVPSLDAGRRRPLRLELLDEVVDGLHPGLFLLGDLDAELVLEGVLDVAALRRLVRGRRGRRRGHLPRFRWLPGF